MDDQLTFEQIEQFLADKWTNWNCERCNSSSWEVGERHSQRTGAFITPSEDGKYNTPGTGVGEVVLAICQNCGNVRTTAAKIIMNWAHSKKGA